MQIDYHYYIIIYLMGAEICKEIHIDDYLDVQLDKDKFRSSV